MGRREEGGGGGDRAVWGVGCGAWVWVESGKWKGRTKFQNSKLKIHQRLPRASGEEQIQGSRVVCFLYSELRGLVVWFPH